MRTDGVLCDVLNKYAIICPSSGCYRDSHLAGNPTGSPFSWMHSQYILFLLSYVLIQTFVGYSFWCTQSLEDHLNDSFFFFVIPTLFFDSQIITMRDYVPKIIGLESFEDHIGPYRGYDPTTDPSASNVFATAAFRFGHATIPPILRRLNESFQEHEHFPHLRLSNTLFSPWRIVKEGQYTLMKLPIRTNNIYCKHMKHTIKRVEGMKKILNLGQPQHWMYVC